jgi:hypothetical protein
MLAAWLRVGLVATVPGFSSLVGPLSRPPYSLSFSILLRALSSAGALNFVEGLRNLRWRRKALTPAKLAGYYLNLVHRVLTRLQLQIQLTNLRIRMLFTMPRDKNVNKTDDPP